MFPPRRRRQGGEDGGEVGRDGLQQEIIPRPRARAAREKRKQIPLFIYTECEIRYHLSDILVRLYFV